jgi:hypothetical protein
LLIFVLLVLAIIPTLINQLTALIERRARDRQKTARLPCRALPRAAADSTSTMRQMLAEIGETIQAKGAVRWPKAA